MKQITSYILTAFLLIACSEKSFVLEKTYFNYPSKQADSKELGLLKRLSKYPDTIYSFGTCEKIVQYKGVFVNEYTTDCSDPEDFVEETFLIFLDNSRVYYYSEGRKSKFLQNDTKIIEENDTRMTEKSEVEMSRMNDERRQISSAKRKALEVEMDSRRSFPLNLFSNKKKAYTSKKIKIALEKPTADYQRRGHYEIKECRTRIINENGGVSPTFYSNTQRLNEAPTDTINYRDSGYCLSIELERPINKSKAKKAKKKIPKAIAEAEPESEKETIAQAKAIAKDKAVTKYADRVYMEFRILEAETGKLALKLDNLTKPYNRSRILGAVENRTIYVSQTFREQVVFSPRVKDSLVVQIKDSLYNQSQLPTLSW